MTPEGAIQNAILEYLRLRHIFAWRNNSGAVQRRGRDGRVHTYGYGLVGSSDILGVMPDDSGRLLAIEVKAPTGRLSPAQRDFIESLNSRNCVAFVARSVEDVEREIKAAMAARRNA
jgi:hypothetical protein